MVQWLNMTQWKFKNEQQLQIQICLDFFNLYFPLKHGERRPLRAGRISRWARSPRLHPNWQPCVFPCNKNPPQAKVDKNTQCINMCQTYAWTFEEMRAESRAWSLLILQSAVRLRAPTARIMSIQCWMSVHVPTATCPTFPLTTIISVLKDWGIGGNIAF